MENKKLIVVICGIILIIFFVLILNDKSNNRINQNKKTVELNYNIVMDNSTGDKYYQIYDVDNGQVVRNVTDEASVKMYLENPDFVGTDEYDEYDNPNVWDAQ